jgi:Kdo2-lipid IVA lauroyltransferase/acyltransferase
VEIALETPTALTRTAAPREREGARRWYFHRFNTPLSWELILRITPRLPLLILIPLHHVTSLVFCLCMGKERRAARSNLRRITGKKGLANLRLTYRLFYNFSRFMVAYTEIRHLEIERFHQRLVAGNSESLMRDLIREEKGLIIATAHLGHWDLGLKLLQFCDRPVHAVMLSEDPVEVTRYADEARQNPNLRVHQMGSTPLLAVELMLALKRGEIVAIQADRPVGQRVMSASLFGAPTSLPTGPVELAMATGAPILPVFILLDRSRRYRILTREPMRFQRFERGTPEESMRAAMSQMAAMLESVISRYPDQWFNFYDVWPTTAPPLSEPPHA